MGLEIGRRLIDGIWRTGSVDESDGGGGGGSLPWGLVKLRTSLDLPDPRSAVPVLTPGDLIFGYTTITLPPALFGNDGTVSVRVYNDGPDTFDVNGSLFVVSVAGTAWLSQDAIDQTVPAVDFLDVDFASSGGSAGAGLAWNSTDKRIDIASTGVYSAVVLLLAKPTP